MREPPRRRRPLAVREHPLIWITRKVFARSMPVLRVLTFLFVVYLVIVAVAIRGARAEVGDALLSLGPEMLRYDEALRQEPPRTLWLNGQPIRLATGVTDASLPEVLDWYEAECQAHDGQLGARLQAQLDTLRAQVPEVDDVDASMLDPVLRDENADHGYVACLDQGAESVALETLAERATRFQRRLDVSELGDLRYLYVQRGTEKTFFALIWTEGSLPIGEMFPAAGDAPGGDVAEVPRPPGSRRILSAREEGYEESVTSYVDADQNAETLGRFYRGAMAKRGFTLLALDENARATLGLAAAQTSQPGFFVFEKGSRVLAVQVHEDPSTGRGGATVLTFE